MLKGSQWREVEVRLTEFKVIDFRLACANAERGFSVRFGEACDEGVRDAVRPHVIAALEARRLALVAQLRQLGVDPDL